MLKTGIAAAMAAALILGAGPGAQAQDLPKQSFKVVGSFGNLSNWLKVEKPFWTEQVVKDSKNQITATAQSTTELNLKGTEVMRLLKLGLFDFAHALPIYVAEDATLEGVDIAGVAKDMATARKITEVWGPQIDKIMGPKYGAKILNWYTFPTQMIWCAPQIKSVADLKGKKIRVQGVSQGDLVEGLGATAVTIPFGEVVPALQRGTVDCGITGTMPAYRAGWHEVVTSVLEMPVGFTIIYTAVSEASWNKMGAPTKEFFTKEMKAFEDGAWKTIGDEVEMGLICVSGEGGTCSEGKPGKVVRIKPSEADLKARETALNDVVLKRWAKRCGSECAKTWTDTVGKLTGLVAAQ
jgi:TRAP-type C4-dicarboxylate transport system substrate-binding protein